MGQRGNDKLSGNNGNDILVGDVAYTPSAALYDAILPTSLVATRLFNSPQQIAANNAAPTTLQVTVSSLGSLIIAPMMMLPREMELPISSVESVGSWTHTNLRSFEGIVSSKLSATYRYGGIPSSGTMYFQPLISFNGIGPYVSTIGIGDYLYGMPMTLLLLCHCPLTFLCIIYRWE
jgi:Ca2+-binding RTX toxin-like protein